jgi:linoleoyl-CoA desaturase
VLALYPACSWVVGFVLAVVFQLAHCNDRVDFVADGTPRRGSEFVTHQLATTADVRCAAPIGGPAFAWLAGGLQHQVAHHLAPRLPHTAYPSLARRPGRPRGAWGPVDPRVPAGRPRLRRRR